MGHGHNGTEFGSFGDFADFLDIVVKRRLAQTPVLELAAQEVERTVKNELGTYQRRDMGPFTRWAELSPSTKKERVRKGYTENDPLLRSGELRDSIGHETDVSENSAVIGTALQKAIYLELGTKRMPPRSIFGLAAHRSRNRVIKIVGGATVAAMLNVEYDKNGHGVWTKIFQHTQGED